MKWKQMTNKQKSHEVLWVMNNIPHSEMYLKQIFKEVEGKKDGTYRLGAKFPWHYITRPDLKIKIISFYDYMVVRLVCLGKKTVEFTFDEKTGNLISTSYQIVTMWPVANVEEFAYNIEYAYNLLVRYGINPERDK